MKTPIARSPLSMGRISAAGTWWSTKRVRRLSAAVAAVAAAATVVAEAAVVIGVGGAVVGGAAIAEIVATAAIAGTAGNRRNSASNSLRTSGACAREVFFIFLRAAPKFTASRNFFWITRNVACTIPANW